MKHHILSIAIAAAFISGCSNGGSGMGAGIPSAIGHSSAAASVALNGPARVSPDKKAKGAYAYIVDWGGSTIYVYNFDPKTGMFGEKVGSTSSGILYPQGACAHGKDAWIINESNTVFKFKAPSTTPSGSVGGSAKMLYDCSLDENGDLAVTNEISGIVSGKRIEGFVEIFKKATGTPTLVTCSNIQSYFYLAYDKNGNIFVDGENSNYAFAFCEIKPGASSGTPITLNVPPISPGGVHAGKDIAILDQDGLGTIDKYAISGKTGTEVGTVTLSGASDPQGDWIVNKHVLTANAKGADVTSFAYPAGGTPVSTVSGFNQPVSITIVH